MVLYKKRWHYVQNYGTMEKKHGTMEKNYDTIPKSKVLWFTMEKNYGTKVNYS